MALARWERPALIENAAGYLVLGGAVWCEVRTEAAGNALADLFEDRDGLTPLANPFLASDGVPGFHVAGGSYQVRLYKTGYDETFRYQAIGTGAEVDSDAFVPFTPASASGAASIALAEDTDNGSNTVTLKAPASVTADRTVTLPDASGTALVGGLGSTDNRLLRADGTGGQTAQGSTVTVDDEGRVAISYSSSTPSIRYGFTAEVKGSGTDTNHVVAAQLNAYSINSSGARSVWGIATEAWSGDNDTAPSVTATLIGAETSIISQYNANSSALIGMDVIFKDRPDGDTASPGGLGSNAYNLNSRAIQIDSQARSSDGEYCGWVTGIQFSATSIDRSNTAVNGVLIDASAVDPTRLAAGIRLPEGIGLSWTSDVRSLRYSSGSLVWRVSEADVVAFDGNGTPAFNRGIAVPAGGNNAYGVKMSSTANFGLFFGSGAPTLSAAQGSLYIRTDGSSASTRMYINTDGSTGWTNVTTAA